MCLFLQKKVEEHGMYISAYQEGLGARHRLTIGGLVIFVVILVTITAAFTIALVHHKHKGCDETFVEMIDSNHQIGYQ